MGSYQLLGTHSDIPILASCKDWVEQLGTTVTMIPFGHNASSKKSVATIIQQISSYKAAEPFTLRKMELEIIEASFTVSDFAGLGIPQDNVLVRICFRLISGSVHDLADEFDRHRFVYKLTHYEMRTGDGRGRIITELSL